MLQASLRHVGLFRLSRLLPATALLLAAGTSEAQEGGVANRAGRSMPPRPGGEASFSFRPSVSFDGDGGAELAATSSQTAVSVRFQLGPRTFLTPGISYQNQSLDYDGMDAPGNHDLHALDAPIMLVHILNQKWSLMGRSSVGLSGDFATLERHFSASTAGLAVYRVGPRLGIGLGAAVSYAAGGQWLPLPVATVNWQATDKLRVEAFLPLFAKATYRAGDRFEVGAALQGEGARWGLDGDEGEATQIDYYSLDAGAHLGMRLIGTTWINLFGGWNLLRRYDIEGGMDDGAHDPDPGLVMRAGLEMRLPGS